MQLYARYLLLFFCRIARFLTSQYAQRFIFWSLDHQALYTSLLAELPSHDRVGLHHFVERCILSRLGKALGVQYTGNYSSGWLTVVKLSPINADLKNV